MNREFFVRWLFWIPVAVRALVKMTMGLLGISGRAGQLLGWGWSKLSHFFQNLIIGVLIALVVHFAHGTRFVGGAEDLAVDWMNRLQVNTEMHQAVANWEEGVRNGH